MRVFEWDDGFTPYSAVWDGVTLTELQECTVERVSRLVRRPAWDGHVNATDNAMTDGFASGDVDGVAVAWIDGEAFELAPSGDFDCCAAGAHDDAPVSVSLTGDDGDVVRFALDGVHVVVSVTTPDQGTRTARVSVDAFADASAFIVVESDEVTA